MKLIISLISLLFCVGCAVLRSKTVRYDASTGEPTELTRVSVVTFWDSQSSLTKFRNTTGQIGNGSNVWSYPGGTSIGGLDESATSTNINQLIGVIVGAAVKAAVKP